MPGTVLTAVVLAGLLGVVAGGGTIAYGAMFMDGGGPLVVLGAGAILLVGALAFGLAAGSRWAQVVAGAIGVIGAVGALAAVAQGNLVGVVWAVLAALIGALATIPVSAREWFSHT